MRASAVCSRRRSPTSATEHLRSGRGLGAGGCRGRDHQLARAAERDEFAIGNDDRARAEAGLGPLFLARREVKTLQRRLLRRVTIGAIEMPLEEDGRIHLRAQSFRFPQLLRLAVPEPEETGALTVSGRKKQEVTFHNRVTGVDSELGEPADTPCLFAAAEIYGDVGGRVAEQREPLPGALHRQRRRVTGALVRGPPDDFARGRLERETGVADIQHEQIFMR